MPRPKKMIGQRCSLAPLCPEDATAWARWDTDLTTGLQLGPEAYTPVSEANDREWIERAITNRDHTFSIVLNEGDVLIGRCMLMSVDHVNGSAMLGIVIGEEEHRGQGHGQEAITLLLDYAFNVLNLNSVMLGTYAFNQRAIACYRRVGFREIGRRRQVRRIAGRWVDAVLMDILADEFASPHVRPIVDSLLAGSK